MPETTAPTDDLRARLLRAHTETVEQSSLIGDLRREIADRDEDLTQLRADLAEASEALCAVGKAALTVAPTLEKPYRDAPETSPWTQFMEQPARRAYNLGVRLRRQIKEANRG
jgi:hypothetical protein